MSLDGQAEAAWILQTLTEAEIAVFEEMPDGTDVPRYSDNSVKPYSVVDFGEPIPQGSDRGLGFDDTQPHIFPITVTNIASTKGDARAQSAAVNNALIGKTPDTGGNASQIRGTGGFMYTVRDASNAPTRFHRFRYLEMVINLAA